MNVSLCCLICCIALFCPNALAESVHCEPDSCENFDCGNEKICGVGTFLREDDGSCRCCSACVRIIGENDPCSSTDPDYQTTLHEVCEEGTDCQESDGIEVCTKIPQDD